MEARVGDRIIIESKQMRQPPREGEILEVIPHPYGTEYRVKWDDGRETSIRPTAGSARIVPTRQAAATG